MRSEWALLGIVPLLMLVHGLPHLPNEAGLGPPDEFTSSHVPYELLRRANDAFQDGDYPYPVHADEHIHLAWMAQVVRQETADIDDPYVGGKETDDLFTVAGMRSERGWNVAIVQFHLLTDIPLMALARFLPAIWAGFLGVTMWLALRPAPGAMVGAAIVAVLPTTLRFLGIGFLVPSSFALPWVLLTLILASKTNGPGRFFGLLLVITAAHFMHLVLGILSIGAALAGTATRMERPVVKATMAGAALLPLLWIIPTTLRDAIAALSADGHLTFQGQVFLVPGILFYILASIGLLLAFSTPNKTNSVHRAMALLAIPVTLSMFISAAADHRNTGTYDRQMFAFFLCFAGLASYGIGQGLALLRSRIKFQAPSWSWGVAGVALASLIIAPAVASHLSEPYYRLHDDDSWAAAEVLDGLNLTADDVLLSDPEHGPLYSSITGARLAVPFTPSSGAVSLDWEDYESSGGADADWLQERGITYVIGLAPNAPHEALGSGVYRLA